MFLSIATTHRPATDLGFLLRKNPTRLHEEALPFGRALMAYPEASEARCEFVLALDVDPVALVRGRPGGALAPYVSDRPYAASSFLAVAIARSLGAAMGGRSRERPELAEQAIPLEAVVAPVPLRSRADLPRRLFEPLGWRVSVAGEERHAELRLEGRARLAELLTHLYVLIPALDGSKHYWVGEAEVDKLVAKGGAWLAAHPERETIASLYLARRRSYVSDALARLDEVAQAEGAEVPAGTEEPDAPTAAADPEAAVERPVRLQERRHEAVVEALRELGAARLADVGCAEGHLAVRLARERAVEAVLALDASSVALRHAETRVGRLPSSQKDKVRLLHGALGYRDHRLDGLDAIALVEVVEHLDPERLPLAMRALMASRPRALVVTTPNREHNAAFGLAEGALRHPDHRFEWTRAEFVAWAEALAAEHGYRAAHRAIGEAHPELGPPTQMAILSREGAA